MLPEWGITKLYKKALFFGVYHIGDYIRVFVHRGPKTIFWCGGDIVNLYESGFSINKIQRLFKGVKHVCENEAEQEVLFSRFRIVAKVHPMFFGQPDDYKISFKSNKEPHVFMCSRTNREIEYGLNHVFFAAKNLPHITFHIYGAQQSFMFKNLIYHGEVSEKQFDEEIKNYQCGLRLNLMDGFSEVTAKSILMGQYPITIIPYSGIDRAENPSHLLKLLDGLKLKREPNYKGRDLWLKKLTDINI